MSIGTPVKHHMERRLYYWMECGCGNVWDFDPDDYESRPPPACPNCDMPPELVRTYWQQVYVYDE